jgi:putative glycosyl hydrolase protein
MSSSRPSKRPKYRSNARRLQLSLGALLTTLALAGALGASEAARAEVSAASSPPHAEPARARSEESLTVRGIYLQQLTAQDEKRLPELIDRAKAAGLNTFVVDLWRRSPDYAKAVATIQSAGLRYVPRITIFPDGARPDQIASRQLLEKRWRLIDYALGLGAKDIQLDYIRFSSRNPPSSENAGKVLGVLRFFRERIKERGARLQIDVFGEVSYAPSIRIGQDMRVFAPSLDAVCPMLYPSHFEPYRETAKAPYETVHGAILALERQTKGSPLPIYPYIEHFNYRHRMTEAERAIYFEAQLQAVLDSSAQGFYVWSVGNYYDIPFAVLERRARERHGPAPLASAQGPSEHGSPTSDGPK